MPLTSTRVPATHDGGEIRFTMMDGHRIVDCFVHPFAIDDISQTVQSSPANRMRVFDQHRAEVEAIASDLFDDGERRPYVTSAWVQRYLRVA